MNSSRNLFLIQNIFSLWYEKMRQSASIVFFHTSCLDIIVFTWGGSIYLLPWTQHILFISAKCQAVNSIWRQQKLLLDVANQKLNVLKGLLHYSQTHRLWLQRLCFCVDLLLSLSFWQPEFQYILHCTPGLGSESNLQSNGDFNDLITKWHSYFSIVKSQLQFCILLPNIAIWHQSDEMTHFFCTNVWCTSIINI